MLSTLLVSRDLVTGLADRDSAERWLRAEPRKRSIAVIYIKVELLAELEHALGRFAVDEALSDYAERVKRCIRAKDLFARLGADVLWIGAERVTRLGLRSMTDRIRSIKIASTLTHREIRMHTVVWSELLRRRRAVVG